MIYLSLLCLGFILNKIGTRLIISLAKKHQLFEAIDHRKIHTEQVCALGGVSLFFSLWSIVFLFTQFSFTLVSLFLATMVLFIVGLWDDLKSIGIKPRLLAQLIAANLAYFAGFHFGFSLEILNYSSTIIFIIVMINGVNFIDGINGLAGSLGLVGFSFFAGSFYYFGYQNFMIISLIYVAILLSFLIHNYGNKASIFMGDNGSTVMGFLMAIFSLKVLQIVPLDAPFPFFTLLVLAIIGLPILDLLTVVIIRLSKKQSPFKADRIHLHHLLTDSGKSHPESCQFIIGWILSIILFFYYQIFPSFQLNIFLLIGSYLLIRGRFTTFKAPAISVAKWDKTVQQPKSTPGLNFE